MGKMVTSLSSSQSSLRNNSNSSSNSNSNNRIEKQQQEQHNQEKKQIPLLFAHHDINFANVIAIYPGQIQWNDFNLGIINRYTTHDSTTPTTFTRNIIDDKCKNNNNARRHLCPVPIRYAS